MQIISLYKIMMDDQISIKCYFKFLKKFEIEI